MPYPYPFGEAVIQLDGQSTSLDEVGVRVRTYPVKAVYSNAAVAPSSAGTELVQGQDLVITGLTVYLPDSASVSAVDRFVVRGSTWEVQGDPQHYVHPFTGWRPGVPVTLQRVTG